MELADTRASISGSSFRVQLCNRCLHAHRAGLLRKKEGRVQPDQDHTRPPDVTRTYQRFTDVVDDTINARIWLGIHFRTPDEQGAELGENVADWLDRRFFDKR